MPSGSFTHSVTHTPCTRTHVLGEVEFGETNEVLYVNSEVFRFAQEWLPENKGRTACSGGPARPMLRLKPACPWVPRSLGKGQLIQSCWIGRRAFVGCPSSSPRMRTPSGRVSTIKLGPTAQDWVTPQGPKLIATHVGLDLVSTGHQAKISQVPFCALPSRRQRPVLTPAGGGGQAQCQEPPGSSPSLTPSPGRSRPHHFQPQQAPQEGSRCPHSTGHREHLHSARRESTWAGVPLLRSRSRPRGRTGAPPLPGATHALGTCFSPEPCRHAHQYTHSRRGPWEGVETPASGERWAPSTACTSPIPTPCSQH